MIPLCIDQGIGIIPWSPLARGRLARQWDDSTNRSENDELSRTLYSADDRTVVDAVGQVADQRGIPRAQVAIAWALAKPGITAPIVGATKPHHLGDAIAAVDVHLSPDEIELLEKPYRPHVVSGFR